MTDRTVHDPDAVAVLAARVADEIGLPAEQIEKDFWVTEVLRGVTRAASELGVEVVFKGGTSLSKASRRASKFARRPLALSTETLSFVPLPIHKHYGFELPSLPVVNETEACAEKLARYRRIALGRDLYNLCRFANGAVDEALVRRLWVLKVWGDVVDDKRGDKPLEADDVLRPRRERDYRPDSIGALTRPIDIVTWEARVRTRFQFLADLDDDERRWATCDERHRLEVEAALVALTEGL